jgi:hypothetical protein
MSKPDIVTFAETLFVVDRAWVPDGRGGWRPERDRPIVLFDWQKRQLRDVFPPEMDGRPMVRNYLDSEVKKLGKSTKAAIVATYLAATEPGAEVYICAADQDQARDRVFRSIKYAVEHGPLSEFAKAYRDWIGFSNGATIQAFPMDYKGASGGEPICTVFDELHTYSWESERRLYDEMIIPISLPYGIRWVASYAGYTGESILLREVWDRVEAGELQEGWPEPLRVYHNDEAGWWGTITQGEASYQLVPWGQGERGERYLQEARDSERPLSYRRLFCNEWMSSESVFVPPQWWAACRDPELKPLEPTPAIPLYVGVDVAVKPGGDDAAVIAVYKHKGTGLIRTAWHRVWLGGKHRRQELRLGETLEPYLLSQAERYHLAKVFYDPRFMVNTAQRLKDAGLPMEEVTQSRSVLGPLGQQLYALIQGQRLAYYPHEQLEEATAGAVVREIPQGLHIVKGTGKVDLLMALSFTALAVEEQVQRVFVYGTPWDKPSMAEDPWAYRRERGKKESVIAAGFKRERR